MGFYDLSKAEREKLTRVIYKQILEGITKNTTANYIHYLSDNDTYIRKIAYLKIGEIFLHNKNLHQSIVTLLTNLLINSNFKVRQTSINAAGEIGMHNFSIIENLLETGLVDSHHSVRNAVIGSMKKIGKKNPVPLLSFARKYIDHPSIEIRREICHGIELRGRTHPEDILPILEKLQNEDKARVRNMVVHVLGQIAYKKGCLEKVITALNKWSNKKLTQDAVLEVLDVHIRYKNFSFLSYEYAHNYIMKNFNNNK